MTADRLADRITLAELRKRKMVGQISPDGFAGMTPGERDALVEAVEAALPLLAWLNLGDDPELCRFAAALAPFEVRP